MEIARIQVSGVQARAVRKLPAIPAKLEGGYITLEYTDSLWEGLTKTVVFRSYLAIGSLDDRSEVVKDVVTNDTIIKVPPEVLEKPGRTLEVGFYGTRTDDTVAIPTFYAKISEVREAADPSGDESTNPTLPVYAQLAERVEALEKGGGGSGGVGPQGPAGADGDDGGYYSPSVSQPDANTVEFSFAASKGGMPAVEPVQVELPCKDAVLYTPQELSEEQAAQARKNIGITGRKSIQRSVNFVGMSIWWYDGNMLAASGFGGGVICRGYQTLLKEYFDFSSTKNYCYSGFSLGSTSADDTSSIMASRASEWAGSEGDIWTLDTITNDFKRNIPIGTITDYTEGTGSTTYYGALRGFADKVAELSGDDAIVICSNALRRNKEGYTSTSKNTHGHTLLDYEYALMNVAARNNWYFVDQYRLSSITDETLALTTLDGLHLNNFGYTLAIKPWIEQFGIVAAKLLGEYGSADNPDSNDFDITGDTTVGEVISSTGAFAAASSSWIRTDYIEVSEGKDYAYYGFALNSVNTALVYGYNEVKEPVIPIVAATSSGETFDSRENGMVFTIPSGVKYIACCSVVTDAFAVKKLDVTGFVSMGGITINAYLNSTGEMVNSNNWRVSARIFVDADRIYKYYGNTSVNASIPCVCGYDATGAFVGVILASGDYTSGKEFTVPNGVTYVRYCSVASAEILGIYKYI